MRLKLYLLTLFVFFSVFRIQAMEVHDKTDSVTLDQFTRHIYSLDYIVRKADNSNFFLNLSDDYCDSILALDSENTIAQSYKQRNNLIRSTCSENLNYKIRFYSLFAGIPAWMGFADDPIEYAYDHALEQLLVGKYFQLYKSFFKQRSFPCKTHSQCLPVYEQQRTFQIFLTSSWLV